MQCDVVSFPEACQLGLGQTCSAAMRARASCDSDSSGTMIDQRWRHAWQRSSTRSVAGS